MIIVFDQSQDWQEKWKDAKFCMQNIRVFRREQKIMHQA